MQFKQLLREKDLTGAQLGRRIGVSRWVVSYWTSRKGRPHGKYIPQIAEALGVSVEDVVKSFEDSESEEEKEECEENRNR